MSFLILLRHTRKPSDLSEASLARTVQPNRTSCREKPHIHRPLSSCSALQLHCVMGCPESVCLCAGVLVLTLSNSIKGLNEGFDSSSRLCVGISAGVGGRGWDHGDAAPVTAVIRVRHSRLFTLGPGRHNEQDCCVDTQVAQTLEGGETANCDLVNFKTLNLELILWDNPFTSEKGETARFKKIGCLLSVSTRSCDQLEPKNCQ